MIGSDDDMPVPIGHITTYPPEDLCCNFCGNKTSTAIATVLSPSSDVSICFTCVSAFYEQFMDIVDEATEQSRGAPRH